MNKLEKIMSRVTIMLVTILLVTSCSCQNFFWSHTYIPEEETVVVEYGLLYNWWATTDLRGVSSDNDWVVPTKAQLEILQGYLGGASVAGGKLKEVGSIYWGLSNAGTNEVGFNGRGSNFRKPDGGNSAVNLGVSCCIATVTDSYGFQYQGVLSSSVNTFTTSGGNFFNGGASIRLLYVGTGTPTSYTGNDGKIYRVVTIGTQTWLADNLAETKFRNGDVIPWHGANPANYFTNAEWAALTTAGVCAYDNTPSNVAEGFTFPNY